VTATHDSNNESETHTMEITKASASNTAEETAVTSEQRRTFGTLMRKAGYTNIKLEHRMEPTLAKKASPNSK